jgi:protein involved in polysaccharide export with SLBB domain
MKRFFQFVVILLVTKFLYTHNIQAQNQSTGSTVSTYQGLGNQYFVDEAGLQLLLTASPLDEFIDENTYYLGPYDVLSIQGNGLIEFSYRAIVVNASGDITAPLIGSVSLKGKTLAEAKEIISVAFQNQVKETEISVTLDQPRPINVHVGGNIPNPGRYVLPAGTRFDALITGFLVEDNLVTPLVNQAIESTLESTAQRPSYSGLNFDKIGAKQQSESEIRNETLANIAQKYDLRYVKVTPLHGEEYFVDLAGYFNSGNPQFAPFIQDGDHITLINASSTRPTVSISGAVNNPFSGSYRENDTFENLLAISGGYSPDADRSEIVVIRIEGAEVTQIRMSPDELTDIEPGDQIIIKYADSQTNFGSVRIEGEVKLPGSFTIVGNETTLGEILELSGGLTDDALPNAAYLIRSSYDNRGVNSVSSVNLSLLGRSSDQFLEGFDYLEFEQALDPNRMAVNLKSQQVLENTIMQNGDQLFIPRDENTISILGQVNVPGFYTYISGSSVENYLTAANGLTIAADPDRVFIIKAGSRAWYPSTEIELESGDIIFVDRIPFEDISTGRNYAINLQRLKTDRTRLILAGISAATSIVTVYVAVRRLN